MENGTFATDLRVVDILPIFKSINSTDKKNYRPISILRSVPKLFEKLLQTQLNPFFDKHLSEYLCGYIHNMLFKN